MSQNCWSSFIGSFLFSNKNVGLLLLDQTVAFFFFWLKVRLLRCICCFAMLVSENRVCIEVNFDFGCVYSLNICLGTSSLLKI